MGCAVLLFVIFPKHFLYLTSKSIQILFLTSELVVLLLCCWGFDLPVTVQTLVVGSLYLQIMDIKCTNSSV